MMGVGRRTLIGILGVALLGTLVSCSKKSTKEVQDLPALGGSALAEIPAPKLRPLPESWTSERIAVMPAEMFAGLAANFDQEGDLESAIAAQQLAVQKDESARYNLACFLSRSGDVEGAIHHLYLAAEKVGVTHEWASEDPDLVAVRADKRWDSLYEHLKVNSEKWLAKKVRRNTVFVPAGISKGAELPLVVWLHGHGANPDFNGGQEIADDFGIGLIGVSATMSYGANSFVWSEELAADGERVLAGISEFRAKHPVKGRIGIFGFSQGGLMAIRLAASDTKTYAGAFALSPGGDDDSIAKAELSSQVYRCSANQYEHQGNVLLARSMCARVSEMGARSTTRIIAGAEGHTFPPNFNDQFQTWILQSLSESIAPGTAAIVNGVEILEVDLLRALIDRKRSYELGEGDTGDLRSETLQKLIDTELLRQRIKADKVVTVSEKGDSLRLLLQQSGHLKKSKPADAKAFYRTNQKLYQVDESLDIRLIVINEGSSLTEEEAKAKVVKVHEAALAKGADFAKLATLHSMDPSDSKGGLITGLFRGQTGEEFESAAFSLKTGQVSDVVYTSFGYFIIKLEARHKARVKRYSEVDELVRAALDASLVAAARLAMLKELREVANIELSE